MSRSQRLKIAATFRKQLSKKLRKTVCEIGWGQREAKTLYSSKSALYYR